MRVITYMHDWRAGRVAAQRAREADQLRAWCLCFTFQKPVVITEVDTEGQS